MSGVEERARGRGNARQDADRASTATTAGRVGQACIGGRASARPSGDVDGNGSTGPVVQQHDATVAPQQECSGPAHEAACGAARIAAPFAETTAASRRMSARRRIVSRTTQTREARLVPASALAELPDRSEFTRGGPCALRDGRRNPGTLSPFVDVAVEMACLISGSRGV